MISISPRNNHRTSLAHNPSASKYPLAAGQSSAGNVFISKEPPGFNQLNQCLAINSSSFLFLSNREREHTIPSKGSSGSYWSIFTSSKVPSGTAFWLRFIMVMDQSMPWTWRPLSAMVRATGFPVPGPQSRMRAVGGRWESQDLRMRMRSGSLP